MSSCPTCLWTDVQRSGFGRGDGCNPAVLLQAQTANRKELAVERAAKKEAVGQLNEAFKATSVAVVAHYSGLTVAQMQKLRMQMKQAGAR
jgi:large subunit ribosomal protein L10